MENEINEITERVKEYAELSKVIKITQEKLKILNKKKKELYKNVIPKLNNNNIKICNLAFGTLKVIKSKRKITPSRTSLKDKYLSFFKTRGTNYEFTNGIPEEKSNILYNYIYVDNIEYREESSITMSYNKEFKDQFKNLTI